VAESTAIYLYRRLDDPPGQTTLVRRAMVAALGRAGLRNTEVCDIESPDVLFAYRRIRVAHAKTPAGVREVAMTRGLLEELLVSDRRSATSATTLRRSQHGGAPVATRTTSTPGS
jgi:hypothetical protein